jgi:hypothetical protein
MNAGNEPGRVAGNSDATFDGLIAGVRADLESRRAFIEECEPNVLAIRFILDTCYSYRDLSRLMANAQGAPLHFDNDDLRGRHDFVCVRLKATGEPVQMLWGEFIAAEAEDAVEYLHSIPPEFLPPPVPAASESFDEPVEIPSSPGFVLIDNRFVSVEPIDRPADQERYINPISGRYTGRAQFPKPWWPRIFHFVPIYIDPEVCRLRRVVIENCIHDSSGKPVGMIFSEGGEGGTSYCIGYYGAAWAIDGDRSPLNPGIGAVYVRPGEEVALG